jgi:GTP-binding protein HflX
MSKERAIVVGVTTSTIKPRTAGIHLEELARLADTAGAEVVSKILQKRERIDSATLVGSGKLMEIASIVEAQEVDLVLFDQNLTGSQVKKIESRIPVKVMDRSGIILDIFARNAQTAEAKIQVEVAQLEYLIPRLTRAWTHLCRQVGGIGTRGPGETQLEVDRRLIRTRISSLKKRLKKIESIKQHQHDKRHNLFHIALVGYTNAGKSSLMNLLTKSCIKVEDRLFATLDATTRKLNLGLGKDAILSDTVGFIRKLPHHLIESFKSTLSVVCESSLILHVVDASEENFEDHMEVTANVLSELNTKQIPRVTIFNKTDLISKLHLKKLRQNYPEAVFLSVLENSGIQVLMNHIKVHYRRHLEMVKAIFSPKTASQW